MIPTLTQHNMEVPALGFGTWDLRTSVATKMVHAALEAGYRHIDTAQFYGNEAEVAAGIRHSGVPREKIFLTTKVWKDRLRKRDFVDSVKMSLEKMQLSYVDLLLIHWPNPAIPLEETLEALLEVQAAGMTTHIGVSNFPVKLLQQCLAAGVKPFTNQVEYHPFLDQRPLLDYLRQNDILLTAYSPIAQGKVIGNEVLKGLADKYGKHETQISLRWLMQQGVMAIPRTSKVRNLKANMDIFDFRLMDGEMEAISALGKSSGRLVNPADGPEWD